MISPVTPSPHFGASSKPKRAGLAATAVLAAALGLPAAATAAPQADKAPKPQPEVVCGQMDIRPTTLKRTTLDDGRVAYTGDMGITPHPKTGRKLLQALADMARLSPKETRRVLKGGDAVIPENFVRPESWGQVREMAGTVTVGTGEQTSQLPIRLDQVQVRKEEGPPYPVTTKLATQVAFGDGASQATGIFANIVPASEPSRVTDNGAFSANGEVPPEIVLGNGNSFVVCLKPPAKADSQ